MNYIWHLICATSISFGTSSIPPPHMTATWTQVYQVASNFEESYLSSTCSSTWTRSECTEWTFESESSATQNPETAKKSQFCCEHQTIVEDWRGMVVVNWMIFFFICFNDAHDLYRTERILICNPLRVEKKSDIPMMYHQNFYTWPWTYGGIRAGIPFGNFDSHLGIPWDSERSRYAQIPSTDDLQQRSTTTQVAPWRTEKNPQVECWTVEVIFFNSLITFFWLCWSPWSIPNLSMHCTWNSLINLEEKEQRFGIGIFFPKIFSTFHGRDVSSPFRPSHHFVGVGRRCLVLRNQRFNAGVNKNDRCPQGQSYLVNQQRGCWDGITLWLKKIACYHKRHGGGSLGRKTTFSTDGMRNFHRSNLLISSWLKLPLYEFLFENLCPLSDFHGFSGSWLCCVLAFHPVLCCDPRKLFLQDAVSPRTSVPALNIFPRSD